MLQYQAVFILDPHFVRKGNKFVIAAHEFKTGRGKMAMGGEWRLRAAAELYRQRKVKCIVFVGGWSKKFREEKSAVRTAQFRKSFGIPVSALDTLESDPHTIGNVKAIRRYIRSHKTLRPEQCAVLTNFYHIPRTAADLHRFRLPLRLLAAESFCTHRSIWMREMMKLYRSKAMQVRIRNELRGMFDKEQGRYRI